MVDTINYTDTAFLPTEHYDTVFDIYTNLQRLAPHLPTTTIKLLHLTGSYAPFQNQAELGRVRELEERRKSHYSPKRLVRDVELFERSLQLADACSLIGNEVTLRTFPENYRQKISLVTVSATALPTTKNDTMFVPNPREFLWFFGGGMVHKGLDLVLESFAQYPNATLHIIGNVEVEKDFISIYRHELFDTPNIHYHGYILPHTAQFREIANRCVAFLAPSCSESISTAAATVMQYGLYPLVSRATGITLPPNSGIYLEHCSIPEIRRCIQQVQEMEVEVLRQQIRRTQRFALDHYSRDNFTINMHTYLSTLLPKPA
ncbi:MAG: glycosyltransferase [Patescibacteria group bacterium]